MFEKTPADRYHRAVKALQKAEQAHQRNLDALHEALQARNAAKVTPARQAAAKSEAYLQQALQDASNAHRAYWQSRRASMVPDMQNAARMFHLFDRISRIVGDASATPARSMLDSVPTEHEDLVSEAGVPIEGPDCELIEDYLGSWKP